MGIRDFSSFLGKEMVFCGEECQTLLAQTRLAFQRAGNSLAASVYEH